MSPARYLAPTMLAALGLGSVACDTMAPRPAAEIRIVEGGWQGDLVGAALPKPLVVEVLDEEGRVLPGATVTWAVTAGGGIVEPVVSRTDRTGRAIAR